MDGLAFPIKISYSDQRDSVSFLLNTEKSSTLDEVLENAVNELRSRKLRLLPGIAQDHYGLFLPSRGLWCATYLKPSDYKLEVKKTLVLPATCL